MQTAKINLIVPKETAQSYRDAPQEEKDRIRMIVKYSVGALRNDKDFDMATDQLEQTLEEIGRRAEARGATQEIIDDLLNEQ